MSQYFASIFRRRPNEGWFRAGGYDLTTVDIMTGLSVLSILLWAISPNQIYSRLVFWSEGVGDGQVWRMFTWPIAENLSSLFALIGIVFFWSFGQQIEALFGRGKFLAWVLAVAVIPAAVSTAFGFVSTSLGTVQFGLGALFLGASWVYAGTYPNVKMLEVVPLWAVAAGFTALRVLQMSARSDSGGIVILAAVVLVALVAGRSLGLVTAWPIPHIPLGGSGSGGSSSRRRPSKPKRPRRGSLGQRVIEGPWRTDTAAPPPPPARPSSGPSPADQAEFDGLLDKMNSEGGLSLEDKKRLNELSKRLRG